MSQSARRFVQSRTPLFWIVAALFVASLVFRLWASEPTWTHLDEHLYLSIAQNYALHGELTPGMWWLGKVNIIAGSGSGYGIILLSLWLKTVGYSLFWGRALLVVCGLIAAALMYYVARAWWKSEFAGLAALVIGLVAPSAFYTMMIRMDALAILVYALNLWLHIYAVRTGKRWLHLAVGVAIVASFEIHVISLLYGAGFGLYYGIGYLNGAWRARRVVFDAPAIYFGIGLLGAGAVYAAIHILPDPAAYFLIPRSCIECAESIFVSVPKRITRFVVMRPFETIVLIAAVGTALWRRRDSDWHYVLVLAGWLIAESVVSVPPYPHYANHIWPLAALGVGGLAVRTNGIPHRWARPVGLALAVVLLSANLTMHLLGRPPLFLVGPLKDSQSLQYILDHVPHETVIMSSVISFYQLREYSNFLSYRDDGTTHRMALRGETILELWRHIGPQVVFLETRFIDSDPELQQYLREGGFRAVYPDLWIAPGVTGQ